MLTANASCQNLMFQVNRSFCLPGAGGAAEIEIVKNYPLKIVTLIHETQDVNAVDVVTRKISLERQMVYKTQM